MIYQLKPGNVAAMLYVTPEGGDKMDCIYVAENQAVQVWPHRSIEILPLPVRAAVNKHFGTVFALPLDRRGAYLQSLVPWEVEA